MQRLGSPSVFPKLPVSARFRECQVRRGYRTKKWPDQDRRLSLVRRKKCPTFFMPDLVLDLDAEGAEGVRAYDEQVDGVFESKSAAMERELQPVKRRIADFERQYAEYKSNFKTVVADKLHPLRITDFDLLAVALLDSAKASASAPASTTAGKSNSHMGYSSSHARSHADMLDSVLNKNGIPRASPMACPFQAVGSKSNSL
ncbi:hypothetical protein ONZ43_g5140 [Nemania bipapillata]|uniref:Uncharacterized protein n=1 Tax=Nemania bipapillata TaxID=110536 RepID=A0ACC2IE76_9PEZI|nr:hypothetical protein ONZ43_g5140 [Nemania bipapillata]